MDGVLLARDVDHDAGAGLIICSIHCGRSQGMQAGHALEVHRSVQQSALHAGDQLAIHGYA